jgi:hypothetical protein
MIRASRAPSLSLPCFACTGLWIIVFTERRFGYVAHEHTSFTLRFYRRLIMSGFAGSSRGGKLRPYFTYEFRDRNYAIRSEADLATYIRRLHADDTPEQRKLLTQKIVEEGPTLEQRTMRFNF